jgi:hypothetical protein
MKLWILITLFFPIATFAQSSDYSIWEVSGSSKVIVEGASNVNEFQCATANYRGTDLLRKSSLPGISSYRLSGKIEMEVRSFDCENRMMTRDLRETLKAEEYPKITIELLSLIIPENPVNGQKVSGKADITLAGNSRTFDITWTLILDRDFMRLKGTQDFKFTQFNLNPPSKMMGMVQVKNDIVVDFDLSMQLIASTESSSD